MSSTTKEESADGLTASGQLASPGLLLAFSGTEPRHAAWPLEGEARRLILGRDELLARGVHDERVSRQHILIEHRESCFWVTDLGSRNGSFLNSEALVPHQPTRVPATRVPATPGPDIGEPRILHIGRTLLILADDVTHHEQRRLTSRGGIVVGPVLREVQERVALLSRAGASLLITGESGAGKELLAQVCHAAGPGAAGPFVAINCATIPRDLAERLLFGTRRGAYSGAVADADGYVVSAHTGTLFLDEIGDLEASVQAKLLRVLETKQVLPLGATRPQQVDLHLCAATLRDLREEVEQGRFRQDLFFRIGQPEIRLPPLRERLEEVAWLCQLALQKVPAQPSMPALGLSLVEACLLRPWPGNVRELLAEVRVATLLAMSHASATVEAEHLSPRAGLPIHGRQPPPSQPPSSQPASSQPQPSSGQATKLPPEPPTGEPLSEAALAVQKALGEENWNVQRTAERLGMSRAKLRRLIEKHQIQLGDKRK